MFHKNEIVIMNGIFLGKFSSKKLKNKKYIFSKKCPKILIFSNNLFANKAKNKGNFITNFEATNPFTLIVNQ